MGLIDDKKHLGPKIKLAIQFLVAILLACFGDIRFNFFIPVPFIATALSILWIVAIINAFNFLDNMDGLTSGVAIICSAMLLQAAAASGQYFVSALLALLIGALLGFLVFNFNPAKIFLGDSGSLIIGLIISVATIRTTYYHEGVSGNWFNALMPLIVLAVPIYDFISVVVIRTLAGDSPFVGDTRHFSHRLIKRGMTQRQAVLTIYLATATTGISATILYQLTLTGAILVFAQTIMILLIIAILEKPQKQK
jgi:UDP-GlcNAc:undecaprenyl-phosphate GlcNAc-1-phosphate transferase